MGGVDQWIPEHYAHLKRIAARYLANERPGHTLAPTALVHEAYLQLLKVRQLSRSDSAQVKAAFAGEMRRVLVQHARKKKAQKRGGGARRLPLTGITASRDDPVVDILAMEEALDELTRLSDRDALIARLHLFGGLTLAEMEEVVGLSSRTISDRLKFALIFLRRNLTQGEGDEA